MPDPEWDVAYDEYEEEYRGKWDDARVKRSCRW